MTAFKGELHIFTCTLKQVLRFLCKIRGVLSCSDEADTRYRFNKSSGRSCFTAKFHICLANTPQHLTLTEDDADWRCGSPLCSHCSVSALEGGGGAHGEGH